MDQRLSRRDFCATAAAATLGAGAFLPARAQAPHVYTIPVAADYTGPIAAIIDSWQAAHQAMLAWWNETRGARIGVRIEQKIYDTRYDMATLARLWPEMLSAGGAKPLAYLGIGGADVVALSKRLPGDKVPLFVSSPIPSGAWLPDTWSFTFRPTYAHEFAGLFAHLQSALPEKRPLRIATVSSQSHPAYLDPVNGVQALARAYPDRFAVVSTQWVDLYPVAATNQVRELAKANPDIIMNHANTQQATAILKGLKEAGLRIPLATTSHNGITELESAFSLAELEGVYSVFAFAPFNTPGLKAAEVFRQYYKGTKGKWGMTAVQTSAQMLLFLSTVERAAAAVGAGKLTGQAVYDAMLAAPVESESTLGILPTLSFGSQAPFPTQNSSVQAMVVKGGKLTTVTGGWMPVPALAKW